MKLDPELVVAQVAAAFSSPLSSNGFQPVPTEQIHADYVSCLYRSGEQYIEITINCYHRDGEPECRVTLGDGSFEWPERDWNKIALWHLTGTGGNYPFKRIDQLPSLFSKMANDLKVTAEDFLSGDLDRFLQRRAAVNQSREPYKIHTPYGWMYKTSIDPESERLKERYSRPQRS